MARVGLHGHDVALVEVQVVHVVVVTFAGVLELHFHKVGALGVARHVGKPVVGVELLVLTAYGAAAEATVAAGAEHELHILVIHLVAVL